MDRLGQYVGYESFGQQCGRLDEAVFVDESRVVIAYALGDFGQYDIWHATADDDAAAAAAMIATAK